MPKPTHEKSGNYCWSTSRCFWHSWVRKRPVQSTGCAIKNWSELFKPPSQKKKETNDTSFESPYKGQLKSGRKLGVASSWGWPRPLNWKSTTFTRTRVEPLMTEILPVSNILSIDRLWGFLLRYINISYLYWPRNGEPSKFEVWKKCLKMICFTA